MSGLEKVTRKSVAQCHHLLLHPLNLVAEHQRNRTVGRHAVAVELEAVVRQLDGVNPVAARLQRLHALGRVVVLRPLHGLLGAEGGLVNLAVWRCGGYAAKGYMLNAEGV